MGKKSAPKPPSPYKVAAAQSASDRSAAEYNRLMNQVGQEGPDGSLEYHQDGFDTFTDQTTGQTIKSPRYKAVTRLSSGQQAIKDATDATKANNARIAQALSSRLSGTPLDLNTEVEDMLFDIGSKRLAPRFKHARDTAEIDAINRGIRPGSDAYDRLMRNVGETENDAWNQLALTGRGQAVNEVLGKRRFDVDEILSLLGGSPAGSPNENFVPVAPTNTPGVNISGFMNDAYQQQLANWQGKRDAFNNTIGQVLGIGSKAIMYA